MPEAHLKPCYLLETPKAQGATKATIPVDEANAEMGNQQVTQSDIGWLAGIVDGEGYIGFQQYNTRNNHTSYSAQLFIANTDEAIILRAQGIIQKLGVNPYIRPDNYKLKNKPTHKASWRLVVHRMSKLIKILSVINPHLTGMKKGRGELVLEYCQSRLVNYVHGSHYNVMTEREMQIIESCIAKQKRGTSETTRKAQLGRRDLMLAKAYINKREYQKEREKDPVHHARRLELQRIRRGTPEGREQEKEYRRQLNIRRKEALAQFPTEDDIVRPCAKA